MFIAVTAEATIPYSCQAQLNLGIIQRKSKIPNVRQDFAVEPHAAVLASIEAPDMPRRRPLKGASTTAIPIISPPAIPILSTSTATTPITSPSTIPILSAKPRDVADLKIEELFSQPDPRAQMGIFKIPRKGRFQLPAYNFGLIMCRGGRHDRAMRRGEIGHGKPPS